MLPPRDCEVYIRPPPPPPQPPTSPVHQPAKTLLLPAGDFNALHSTIPCTPLPHLPHLSATPPTPTQYNVHHNKIPHTYFNQILMFVSYLLSYHTTTNTRKKGHYNFSSPFSSSHFHDIMNTRKNKSKSIFSSYQTASNFLPSITPPSTMK